jgi:hypothetical protein
MTHELDVMVILVFALTLYMLLPTIAFILFVLALVAGTLFLMESVRDAGSEG